MTRWSMVAVFVVLLGLGLVQADTAEAWGYGWSRGHSGAHCGVGRKAPELGEKLTLNAGARHLSLVEDRLDVDDVATLGGVGVNLRWNWTSRGAIDVDLAMLGRRSTNDRVSDRSGMLGVFALYRVSQRWNVSVGWIGLATERSIDETTVRHFEKGWAVGLGREWRLGKRWMLSADARLLGLRLVEDDLEEARAEAEERGDSPFPEGLAAPEPERWGLMARASLGYRW